MFARRISRPNSSFFLLGPRGTGKSTWTRAQLPKAHVVDLLEEARYQSYLADPALFAAELRALPANRWVVIDEVQRLPALLNEVHRAIEERGLRFALTGSSARKLRRGGTNLLGGRAQQLTMFPFVPEELGAAFRLERALRYGSLPLVWDARDAKITLNAYVQTYLKEEIQAEAAVRNLPGFARFLPIAGLFHGQRLNAAALARDAGVARQTIDGYLEILQDTLLATLLRAFEPKLRVRERRHAKLYFFDAGVVRALKRQLNAVTAEESGVLFEGYVYSLLRFYRERTELCDEVTYWAPSEAQHTEVDFVLSRGEEHLAIEVKTSRTLRPSDVKGLRAIAELP
jgi:predicted AAA+ superfamily ATPase